MSCYNVSARIIQKSSAALFAASLSLSFPSTLKALEPSKSVIQIQNQAEPGSGFFLKIGDRVLFLTAKHVLGSSGELITLILPNGTNLDVPLKFQIPINSLDVAVILMPSTPQGVSPLEASKKNPERTQILTVWGYPVSDHTSGIHLSARSGQYLGSPNTILDGYSLLYGAQTQIGFSGGPILDETGMVVGMHGRSESTISSLGKSVRTGNALGIPIESILAVVARPGQLGSQIDEKSLSHEAAVTSMKRVYEIIANSSLSDQLIEELSRAAAGGIPLYCIEMSKAYYYTFFSSLPDLSKASVALTITKKSEGVHPAYYAFGSLVSRKSADFKKALVFDRILEETANSRYSQYSERRLVDEVKSAVERCANP